MRTMHTKADIAEQLRVTAQHWADTHAAVGTPENDAIAAQYRFLAIACEKARDGQRSLSYVLTYAQEMFAAGVRNSDSADNNLRRVAAGQRLAGSAIEDMFKLVIDWLP